MEDKEKKFKLIQVNNQEKLLRTINNKATGRPKTELTNKFKASYDNRRSDSDTGDQKESTNKNKSKVIILPNL